MYQSFDFIFFSLGTLTINDGHYVGEVYDSKANGEGILTTKDWTFRGTFMNNVRHGLGVYTWDNGTVEEGEFKNEEKDGKVTQYWSNGTVWNKEYENCMLVL